MEAGGGGGGADRQKGFPQQKGFPMRFCGEDPPGPTP